MRIDLPASKRRPQPVLHCLTVRCHDATSSTYGNVNAGRPFCVVKKAMTFAVTVLAMLAVAACSDLV
jgi:hypothetical protein